MRISTNALQKAALSAIFSAVLYAACIPCIKILGKHVAPLLPVHFCIWVQDWGLCSQCFLRA